MRTALIVGISGSIGKALLEALLNNRKYKKVIVLTRRDNRRLKNIHVKKVQVEFTQMENYKPEFELVDDVFCLLGTDYIVTKDIEDASSFEYDYPYQLAKVAKEAGVKNFFFLNSSRAVSGSPNSKLHLRAKLENDIINLNFENLKVFKVNRITSSVNSDSMVYATKKGLGSILNLFSFGALGKLGGTPANVLANKMVQVALGEPDMKPEYQPKDY